jgi:hypothetical protein
MPKLELRPIVRTRQFIKELVLPSFNRLRFRPTRLSPLRTPTQLTSLGTLPHAASDRLNGYARVVRSGPPAPSERPPSRFQSPAILNVDSFRCEKNFPPIRWAYHQLPTKTGHLPRVFQRFSRAGPGERPDT